MRRIVVATFAALLSWGAYAKDKATSPQERMDGCKKEAGDKTRT